MDSGRKNQKEKSSKPSQCSMTIHFNAESKSRANVLYNSLRVDQEPKSVIRELSVNDSTLTVQLSSSSISNLRASSNGILENIKTLSDVIEKFEIAQEYKFDYL